VTTSAPAFAKINLALVVGGARDDGKHEVVTILQRIDLHDTVSVDAAETLVVDGFAEDTIVRGALASLADAVGQEPRWRAHIEKRIPVAAGLGGGSSDAATALSLANGTLARPLPRAELRALAAGIGVDVPFFLENGAQLGTGDGTTLRRVDLPTDYSVLLVVPGDQRKASTGDVYAAFDARGGDEGFDQRAAALRHALAAVAVSHDLAALPRNDLASSPLAAELEAAGAFRADVSGAGPTVYALFGDDAAAARAAEAFRGAGDVHLAHPVEAGGPA